MYRKPMHKKMPAKKTAKHPFAGLIRKKVTKEIKQQINRLYAKEEQLIERREEMLQKTKDIPGISIGGFKLTPNAKNPMEHHKILFELQEGMMPKKLLQFSEIREMAKRNPMNFRHLFDLVYKYFTGEITKKEIETLTKILSEAIRKGKITDMKMAGIHQLKGRRNQEIEEIQDYYRIQG